MWKGRIPFSPKKTWCVCLRVCSAVFLCSVCQTLYLKTYPNPFKEPREFPRASFFIPQKWNPASFHLSISTAMIHVTCGNGPYHGGDWGFSSVSLYHMMRWKNWKCKILELGSLWTLFPSSLKAALCLKKRALRAEKLLL